MQAVQMLLPAVATVALGTALFVPLRDDRRGRRATIGSGTAPFHPKFQPLGGAAPEAPADASNVPAVNAVDAEDCTTKARGENERTLRDFNPDVIDRDADGPDVVHSDATQELLEVADDSKPFLPAVTEGTQRRSLLEPGAALMVVARPFLAARSALLSLLHLTQERGADESLDTVSESDILVERSFASEVASLLRAPLELAAPPDDSARGNGSVELPETTERSNADLDSTDMRMMADSQERVSHENDGPQPGAMPHRGNPQNRPAHENATAENDVAQQNIVVAPLHQRRGERVVPLTRLPLRPQGFAITWTAELAEFQFTEAPSRAQRHEALERLVREPASLSSDVIARAYQEEDGEGRAIALRVLLRNFPEAGRLAFVEALRVGSDEERAIAVDGLTAVDAREELTLAFADRIEAIAAKAALAYVGTFTRADYPAALAPHIDPARIEAILRLLAGVVE